MDRTPTEILRRIPGFLHSSDISRMMRAGHRRLYLVCGEHLYANLLLTMAGGTPHDPQNSPQQAHGRSMLQMLSSDASRGSLEHPARWVRHLSVSWPLFPTGEDAHCCELLLRSLSLASSLLSLELRGRSPPAWRYGIDTSPPPPLLLPHLVALKTDDVQDAICLSNSRRLESVFIPSPLISVDLTVLLDSAGSNPAFMKQLQLSLELTSIQEVMSTFRDITSTFRNLSVLCVEFDLGLDFPERPISWTTMNVSPFNHCNFSGLTLLP